MDMGKVQVQGKHARIENVHYQSFRRLVVENDELNDDNCQFKLSDEVNIMTIKLPY